MDGNVRAGIEDNIRHDNEKTPSRQMKMFIEHIVRLAGEGEANEAAAEFCHKVDDLGRDFFSGSDEVAFVFAGIIAHEDDDFACVKAVDNARHPANLY
jgi:hypothetical protein